MIYKIPVYWQLSGIIEVEANSLQEAIEEFDRNEHGDGVSYDLPEEGSLYIDGSFERADFESIKLENEYN